MRRRKHEGSDCRPNKQKEITGTSSVKSQGFASCSPSCTSVLLVAAGRSETKACWRGEGALPESESSSGAFLFLSIWGTIFESSFLYHANSKYNTKDGTDTVNRTRSMNQRTEINKANQRAWRVFVTAVFTGVWVCRAERLPGGRGVRTCTLPGRFSDPVDEMCHTVNHSEEGERSW